MKTVDILMRVAEAMAMSATNKDTDTARFLMKLGEDLVVMNHEEYDRKQLAKQAWVMTYTGKHLHAFDPKHDQICLEDIAHALSKNNRFTGHSPYNYTVGQHSLHVYDVLRQLGESSITCLMGLIHDGSEAYLQDIAKPFKNFLPDYQEVEELLQDMIYKKYLGFVPTKDEYSVVKMADEILLINEIEQLMPEDDDWFIPDVPKIYVDVTTRFTQEYIKEQFLLIAEDLGARD